MTVKELFHFTRDYHGYHQWLPVHILGTLITQDPPLQPKEMAESSQGDFNPDL